MTFLRATEKVAGLGTRLVYPVHFTICSQGGLENDVILQHKIILSYIYSVASFLINFYLLINFSVFSNKLCLYRLPCPEDSTN